MACDWLDVVDFNTCCHAEHSLRLGKSGMPVYYAQCKHCQFCYAPALHAWPPELLAQHVYNADYALLDPDYLESRPHTSAQQLLTLLPQWAHTKHTHLDYGGGQGLLAQLMQNHGWNSTSYDPFASPSNTKALDTRYDLLTAIEVLEHVQNLDLLRHILQRNLAPDGLLVFTTLLSDQRIIPGERLSWWYASPRNGHISLFSQKSLSHFLLSAGFAGYVSLTDNWHIAYRPQWPTWAAHLLAQPGA